MNVEHELDILAQTRFKNLHLWDMKGSKTWNQVAEECEVSVPSILNLLNFKYFPKTKKGEWRPAALKLAAYFMVSVEKLFPLDTYKIMQMVGPKHERALPTTGFLSLAEANGMGLLSASKIDFTEQLGSEIEQASLKKLLPDILRTLTPREERIIKKRFGFDGEIESLAAIGDLYSTGPERIRQIEAKALRKLRHPSRARQLRPFLGCPDYSETPKLEKIKEELSLRKRKGRLAWNVLTLSTLTYPVLPETFEEFLNLNLVKNTNFPISTIREIFIGYRRWLGFFREDFSDGDSWRHWGRPDLLTYLKSSIEKDKCQRTKLKKKGKA